MRHLSGDPGRGQGLAWPDWRRILLHRRHALGFLVIAGLYVLVRSGFCSSPVEFDPSSGAVSRPLLPMVLMAIVMFGTFTLIAFEVVNKAIASMLGGILAVIVGMVFGVYRDLGGYDVVHDFIGHDLGVIGVIVGTSILVEIVGHSGLFHFIAVKLVKVTVGRPERLLPMIIGATVLFVTFLTISPASLIMASLVLVITRALDYDARPYIIAVAIAANSGALMTFASGICTLMIGTAARLPYVHFFVVSTPLALASVLIAYLVIRYRYRDMLMSSGDPKDRAAKVARFDEWALVKDRRIFYRCALILGLTVIGFATAQNLHVGLDFIAMMGGTAALLFSGFDADEAIKRVKWSVIVFFSGLFVLVGTVQATGLLEAVAGKIHDISGPEVMLAVAVLVPLCMLLSGIVDNIPVAATMIPIVRSMIAKGLPAEPLWWALVAACNLGGNPTPVGSVSSVIALHALEKERGVTIGWGEYMRVGVPVALAQMVLVLVWILGLQHLGLFPALPRAG